jgi:hypothetical protein
MNMTKSNNYSVHLRMPKIKLKVYTGALGVDHWDNHQCPALEAADYRGPVGQQADF